MLSKPDAEESGFYLKTSRMNLTVYKEFKYHSPFFFFFLQTFLFKGIKPGVSYVCEAKVNQEMWQDFSC